VFAQAHKGVCQVRVPREPTTSRPRSIYNISKSSIAVGYVLHRNQGVIPSDATIDVLADALEFGDRRTNVCEGPMLLRENLEST
jgi:hypothetical protein